MNIVARWTNENGGEGRIPGDFGTMQAAEKAAANHLAKHPQMAEVTISHKVGGVVKTVTRD